VHAYLVQLTDFVLDQRPAGVALAFGRRALSELFSTCIQASLTHEEGRSVRFRLLGTPADRVGAALGRDGFSPLPLREAPPLTLDNLRRLNPVAPLHSSTGCASSKDNEWSIWGTLTPELWCTGKFLNW
jgi:hypothetical protein